MLSTHEYEYYLAQLLMSMSTGKSEYSYSVLMSIIVIMKRTDRAGAKPPGASDVY